MEGGKGLEESLSNPCHVHVSLPCMVSYHERPKAAAMDYMFTCRENHKAVSTKSSDGCFTDPRYTDGNSRDLK